MRSPARVHSLRLLAVTFLLLVALGIGWGFYKSRPQTPEVDPRPSADVGQAADPFPLPALSSSPFVNTGPEARFVSSDACRGCHEKAAASYARTGMGRSMAEATPDHEWPDAVFDHPASGRRYQVYREGGRLWHRELLLAPGAAEVVLEEHPLNWVIGSGRHWQTFLTEVDGFLVESPLSWYPRRTTWAMSPGYDRRDQMGFARGVGEGCLICHGGRSEAVDGSLHRVRIHESAIGCERCHGPGSLHVERWGRAARPPGGPLETVDHTIVNPAHLSRTLSDAICEQCHLNSDARLTVRGRSLTDFRPGLPLQDVRLDFQLQFPNTPMKVVGHADQMHRSRCYQESSNLTCTTCHDPHGLPRPEDAVPYYRAACLRCHAETACRSEAVRRQATRPTDNCVECHMPRAPIDVPHLAFTHHRIGIHANPAADTPAASAPPRGPGVLQPFHDLSGLNDLERRRSLGIAYAETAGKQRDPALAAAYNDRAGELLWPLAGLGLHDSRLEYVLFLLSAGRSPTQAIRHLEKALADPDLPIHLRCDGLHNLAKARAAEGRHAEALDLLRQLTRLRRNSEDWLLVAQSERARGNQPAAVEAMEAAVRINTWLPEVHRSLAAFYARQGDHGHAEWHRQRAVTVGP